MDRPRAPSSIASRIIAFMLAMSSRVAGVDSQPMASIRTGEFPRMYAMLTADFRSNMLRYCSTVDHEPGRGGLPSRPEFSSTNMRKSCWDLNGAYELPSTPISSVVTPWHTLGLCSGSESSTRPEWACMSMNPGQTTSPDASIVRRASTSWTIPLNTWTRPPSIPIEP